MKRQYFRGFLTGLSVLLAAQVVHAQVATPAPTPHGAALLLFGSADKISVRAYGYPELSGEYRVNADATVSIPVIGRVNVVELTAADLERVLEKKIQSVTHRDAYVTVEVLSYVPIAITGAVRNSGPIAWQHGMTVLQAVALAGGVARPYGSSSEVGAGQQREAARKSLDSEARALAEIARLTAEIGGTSDIQPPERLVALIGSQAAKDIIEKQKALFLSRKRSLENQRAALDRGIELAKKELDGLRAQQQLIAEQLRGRRSNRDLIRSLEPRGIVRHERVLEEEIKVADLEEKSVNITVSIARVEATVSALDRDKVILNENRRSADEADIARLRKEVADREIELQENPAGSWDVSNSGGTALAPKLVPTYRLIRRDSRSPAGAVVEASAPVFPGEIVSVELAPNGSGDVALKPQERPSN